MPERVLTKDVTASNGREFGKKGDVKDYPILIWRNIAKTLFPKVKDVNEAINKFSHPISDIGTLIK